MSANYRTEIPPDVRAVLEASAITDVALTLSAQLPRDLYVKG